jgi:hypothetical protein
MSFPNLTFSYQGLNYCRRQFTLFQKDKSHYSRAKRQCNKYKAKIHRYPESNKYKKILIELMNEEAE